MNAILAILSITSAVASLMVWIEMHAPQGYEDSKGFHFGDEPE